MKLCTVCKNNKIISFAEIDNLLYWKCQVCEAILLDPKYFISSKSEKKHYLKHNNKIDDNGYKDFLLRLINPIRNKIFIDDIGLDYGCGYAPALAHILRQDGYKVELYDPFFFPNKDIFSKTYDFITCTETAEHFFRPKKEFDTLNSLLKPNGWLGVMTCFLTTREAFDKWYYRRDPTHVVFYAEKTFEVIAKQRDWKCEIVTKDVVLFYKP